MEWMDGLMCDGWLGWMDGDGCVIDGRMDGNDGY
jgi:hypothetical protein